MIIEYKSFPLFIKAVDLERGIFEGYASTFGIEDSYADVVEPGAFVKTINERVDRVKVCWMHQWDNPIGKPLALAEHVRDQLPPELVAQFPQATGGLYTKSFISPTTQGKDALQLLRDGVVDELSIGYDPIKFDFDEQAGHQVRHLREIRLWEFSPVTWGANEAALVTGVKGLNLPEDVLGELIKLVSQPDALTRLADVLRAVSAEPCSSSLDTLTARARALSARFKIAGGLL